MSYFISIDITNIDWCQNKCIVVPFSKKNWICLLLETNSTQRVQNPFQGIILRGHGTGAAFRGWPVYWVPQKFLTTPHRKCRRSPYLFLICLFCYSHPSHLSLSHNGKFLEISTRKELYLSPSWLWLRWFRHKIALCSTFLWMFFLHVKHLQILTRCFASTSDHVFSFITMLFILHDILHYLKDYKILFLWKKVLNITDRLTILIIMMMRIVTQ